jgi:hypothetical protein
MQRARSSPRALDSRPDHRPTKNLIIAAGHSFRQGIARWGQAVRRRRESAQVWLVPLSLMFIPQWKAGDVLTDGSG